jgi:Superinfection immunity protein
MQVLRAVVGLVLIVLIIAAYFAPSITAHQRQATNLGGVVVINLLFGWTVIGWAIALAMACGSPVRAAPAPSPLFGGPCMRCGLPEASHAAGRCPVQLLSS